MSVPITSLDAPVWRRDWRRTVPPEPSAESQTRRLTPAAAIASSTGAAVRVARVDL
nr:hypothetical protein [Streptomyces virginiae]